MSPSFQRQASVPVQETQDGCGLGSDDNEGVGVGQNKLWILGTLVGSLLGLIEGFPDGHFDFLPCPTSRSRYLGT